MINIPPDRRWVKQQLDLPPLMFNKMDQINTELQPDQTLA